MFDLAGRVVLSDAFSGTLDKLISQTRAAGTELGKLDDATTAPVKNATQPIQNLERELSRLQAAARSGTLSIGDPAQLSAASSAIRTVNTDMAATQGTAGRLTSTMSGLARAVGAVGLGFGAIQLGRAALDLVNVGANATALGEALDGLSKRAGVDGRAIVQEIQDAADGTISSVDAMRIVNRQFLSDNRELASQLPQLFKVADAAAKALGTDVAPAFESLIEAISSGQTRQLRTIGLYIDSEAALAAYADTIGKSVSELTLADKQMALFNATMEAGIPLIEATGSASADASDKMASLPIAIRELKQAMGELLVEEGAVDVIAEIAQALKQGASERRAGNNLKAVTEQLREIGETDIASDLVRQQEAIQLASYGVFLRTGDLTLASEFYADALNALADRGKSYLNQSGSMLAADELMAQKRLEVARNTAIAAEEQQSFSDAVSDYISKVTGVEALTDNFASLSGSLGALSTGIPEMPKLPDMSGGILSTDTDALREYINTVATLNPELTKAAEGEQSAAEQTLAAVGAFEAHQTAVINAALAIGDHNAGLQMLIDLSGNAGSGVLGLVEDFDSLTPAAQNAALGLGIVSAAMAELRAQANAPATLNVAVSGVERGIAQIDAMALRLQRVTDPATAKAFRDKAVVQITEQGKTLVGLDEFTMAQRLQVTTDGLDRIVKSEEAAGRASVQAIRSSGKAQVREAGAIRGEIESALRAGLEVTPADMAATEAGTFQDKPLESARRLAAIAERGFAEIQAHPDWAALLKIPPEVLSGSEAELKAWAAQTQQQVQNLARPDLINWDAFIQNFKQGQEDAAAQELTIDIALGKLDEAGLLEGQSKEEARKAVLEQLGLAEPQITFDSMFAAPVEQTPKGLVSDWLAANGETAVPIPAQLVAATEAPAVPVGLQRAEEATTAAATTTPTEPTAKAGVEVAATPATPAAANVAALEKQGVDMAGALFASFDAAVAAQDVGVVVAGYWAADFAANITQFGAMGTSAGGAVATAFTVAVREKVGDVRRELAQLIAPEVADILGRSKGPLP